MRANVQDNQIVICLEGRIDSTNAKEVKEELDAILSESPGLEPVIDAGALGYISSAGLRVLLQLTKRLGKKLTVRNVSPEVYEIFQMTGFIDLMDVTKKLREISVEGCKVIGRGAIGTVYRIDEDTIVKVYELPNSLPMIENEQRRAKQAFLMGIPTAISYDVVKVGEKYGSVFEMLKAKTFNDLLIEHPEQREEIVRHYIGLLRHIHAVEMAPGELPNARDVFLGHLQSVKPFMEDALYERLRGLFEAMGENLHIVHGDIQMKNVMLSGDEPMLIDMDTLSVGDPVFDLMSLYVAYRLFNLDDPNNSMHFLGITNEMCDYVLENTLAGYFEGHDAAEIRAEEDKIRLVACVRFLQLVGVLGIDKPELRQRRIDRALAVLRELAWQVDLLEVGTI